MHRCGPRLLASLRSFLICGGAVGAEIVLLDDITLDPEMGKLWEFLRRSFPGDAIDATEAHPEIRTGGGGTRLGCRVIRTRLTCV